MVTGEAPGFDAGFGAGFGAGIARRFRDEGASVTIVDVDVDGAAGEAGAAMLTGVAPEVDGGRCLR